MIRLDIAPADDPRRTKLRDWLAANPDPSPQLLARAGYVVPHWPEPYGLAADPVEQLIIDEELKAAGVRRPYNAVAIGWAGPTILTAGSDEQRERYLWPMLTGEEFWCQLFSEPDHGSDLSNLSTRAVRDGDEYVVNGAKIWNSHAHLAKFGVLVARTDTEVRKHRGLSYFIVPMDLPGITRQQITDPTGSRSFNAVFFDDVRLPVECRVGEEGDGWRLAKVTLGNERVSLSGDGALWGGGPSAFDLLDLVRDHGGCTDPVTRQELAHLYSEAICLQLIRARTLSARLLGRPPGPEASVRKVLADEHGQRVMQVAKNLSGAAGMITEGAPMGADQCERFGRGSPTEGVHNWNYGFLFSPALSIGGGTAEVQRNIIGELVLKLPREPDVEREMTWAEAQVQRRVARAS